MILKLIFKLKISTHFYINVSKHKKLYLTLNFSQNQYAQNQFSFTTKPNIIIDIYLKFIVQLAFT